MADGIKFLAGSTTSREITDIPEYWFDDILPDDTVIDIGANVGAFALRAARCSRNVVAVEPITCDILEKNIQINGADIRIIRGALGDGSITEIRWDDHTVTLQTCTLRQIITFAGGCDFLKCDCEGAEWQIHPPDLAGIRRIEMELHVPPIGGPVQPGLLDYIGRHYEFTIDRVPCHGPLGLFGYLHASLKT